MPALFRAVERLFAGTRTQARVENSDRCSAPCSLPCSDSYTGSWRAVAAGAPPFQRRADPGQHRREDRGPTGGAEASEEPVSVGDRSTGGALTGESQASNDTLPETGPREDWPDPWADFYR